MTFLTNFTSKVTTVGGVIKRSFGPLELLEQPGHLLQDFTQGSSLRYPLDVGNPDLYPHTVEFQCWLPKPEPYEGHSTRSVSEIPRTGGNFTGPLKPRKEPTMAIHDNEKEFATRNTDLTSRYTEFKRLTEKSDLIAMYLPSGAWQDTINNQYETKSVTEALGPAGLGLESVSGVIDAIKNGQSIVKSVLLPARELITGALAGMFGADPNTMKQLELLHEGYAKNPQFEVIYTGTAMREFQFEFTMTPRNKKEAETCLHIIKRFKYHASPQFLVGGGRYMSPPSYFGIQFKYKNEINKSLPLVSTCVLTQVIVGYSEGGNQFAAYEDGVPIQINMNLFFTEIEMMHKDLRDRGY